MVNVANHQEQDILKLFESAQLTSLELLGVPFKKVVQSFSSINSYELDKVIITGSALKAIGETLKNFDLELPGLLNASPSTLYREYKKSDINVVHKDHLVSVMRALKKGIQAFEDEDDFSDWLNAKIENLGNRRPIDMLHLETGRYEVERALDRIEYGVYG